MIFSQATLSLDSFSTDKNWELATNGYRAHELVWKLFSDSSDRKRDFIFRWDTDGNLPVLHTVSKREPRDREGLFTEVKSKPYDPNLAEGTRLAFQLRANPVVKRRDENGKQRVHDVVMDAKTSDEEDQRTEWEHLQRESLRWLNEASSIHPSRASRAGFRLLEDRFLAESYTRHEFRKSGSGRRIVIVTVDMKGQLEVTDSDEFRQALFDGVGPSKAFGCGLLMVKRA